MNKIQNIFNYEGTQVRTIVKGKEIWFVAKDVCEVLEIKNPTDALKRLDSDERARFNLGRQGETNIVNEPGLYTLILGSRKPEAKQFKRWVTHEVIPSIRKHGAYMTPETIEKTLTNPDFIIQLATQLKEEQQKRIQLEEKVEKDKPYTNFGKTISVSETAINIGTFAKLIYDEYGVKIGRNKLFEWLREKGYLIKEGREKNQPKQKYIEQGLFDIKPSLVKTTEKDIQTSTTLITGKGQVKIANLLLDEFKMDKEAL